MMTTKKHIRHTFTDHWCTSQHSSGLKAWLIKGDFDRFKMTNDLYGSLICDYLLDWTLEVIEAELRTCQKRLGATDFLWNFTGDDITIYVPPSSLLNEDIAQLLWRVCDAIKKSFYHRYMVGAVPLPSGFFDDLSSENLEQLRKDLERMDVVFDFARRQRGYLILFPVGADNISSESLQKVSQVIKQHTGKPVPPVDFLLDWVYDPDEHSCRQFNDGFLNPPSVSFAARSVRMAGIGIRAGYDRRSIYEQVSMACQTSLKLCKQERKQVLLQHYEPVVQVISSGLQPAGGWAFQSPLRWSSERYLRENLYFRQLDQPVLFQFNPVYHSKSHKFAAVMADENLRIEKYRGNRFGVGLKGINEIFGQIAADCLIVDLMASFSKVMQSILIENAIPPAGVHVARFVDRFTVFCERPVFELPQIVEFVYQVATLFNAVSKEIKISHLRTGIVTGGKNSIGYQLFQQLTLTSLSLRSVTVGGTSLPIEVRQNRNALTLREGSLTLERNSFSSARHLDEYRRARAAMR